MVKDDQTKTHAFIHIQVQNKCLICSESIALIKSGNLRHYYNPNYHFKPQCLNYSQELMTNVTVAPFRHVLNKKLYVAGLSQFLLNSLVIGFFFCICLSAYKIVQKHDDFVKCGALYLRKHILTIVL